MSPCQKPVKTGFCLALARTTVNAGTLASIRAIRETKLGGWRRGPVLASRRIRDASSGHQADPRQRLAVKIHQRAHERLCSGGVEISPDLGPMLLLLQGVVSL